MSHFHHIHRLAREHHRKAAETLHRTHRHAKRLLKKHKVALHQIRHHALNTGRVATISTGLLAAPVIASIPTPELHGGVAQTAHAKEVQQRLIAEHFKKLEEGNPLVAPMTPPATATLATDSVVRKPVAEAVKDIVPEFSYIQTGSQEQQLAQMIKDYYGVNVTAELDGIRLNATRGVMAGEQHLPLYPGDSLANHHKDPVTGKISDPTANLSGMVPGLPAYGYFASSKSQVTRRDIEMERYYIAAQTFLSPGWDKNVEKYYKWYKYREVVVFNPHNGKLVAAVIGDAGPNPRLTSKINGQKIFRKFGGSPEVMDAAGLGLSRAGDVFVFFLNNPDGTVPLGPIQPLQPNTAP